MDVAKSISDGFASRCVALALNGTLYDLSHTISEDARVRLITKDDEEAIDILRHSAAHVMAQAVLTLYKDAKLTIGPVVKDGFYYDIDMAPVSEEVFPKIEAEMKKIIKAKLPFERKEVSKADALEFYKEDPYKLELISDLEEGTISLYSQGDFTDLCRGPHLPHTGMIKAFKLMKVSGAYWRADQSNAQLQRIYGAAFFDKKELKKYLNFLEEARKRDHRKIGAALDLFSFHEEAAGMAFFHAKGMEIWNALIDYWRAEHKAGRAKRRNLVHTSSTSGLFSNPGQANYGAAKSGIATFSQIVAKELARYDVVSNCIAPGARTRLTLATPGLESIMTPADGAAFDEWDPANVSPLVAYLSTETCPFTGETFFVQGGVVRRVDAWVMGETVERNSRWTVDELAAAMQPMAERRAATER